MKQLFENWNKYLNESIGVETLEELERVLSAAYEEGLRSHSPEQRTIPIGEPEQGDPSQWKSVDPDPHTEVVRTLMSVVEGYLNGLNNDEPEGDQADQESGYGSHDWYGDESPYDAGY